MKFKFPRLTCKSPVKAYGVDEKIKALHGFKVNSSERESK